MDYKNGEKPSILQFDHEMTLTVSNFDHPHLHPPDPPSNTRKNCLYDLDQTTPVTDGSQTTSRYTYAKYEVPNSSIWLCLIFGIQ